MNNPSPEERARLRDLQERYVRDLEAEIARLKARIAALEEAGEEMRKHLGGCRWCAEMVECHEGDRVRKAWAAARKEGP